MIKLSFFMLFIMTTVFAYSKDGNFCSIDLILKTSQQFKIVVDSLMNLNEKIVSMTPQKSNFSREVFNRDFEFAYDFEDSVPYSEERLKNLQWKKVGLPHSFSIPYFRSKTFWVGTGYYKKDFELQLDSEIRYRLDFEGVFQVCDIFLNGHKVGAHKGGYTGFDVDLTPYLKTGLNQLIIKVDNKWRATLPPRAGEHVFSGGIYRDVYLTKTGTTAFKRNGVKLTTKTITPEVAVIELNYELMSTDEDKYQIDIAVKDKLFLTDIHDVTKPLQIEVETPILWSPDTPYLYNVVVTLKKRGVLQDQREIKLGIRTFEFTKDSGFFLNGQHLWLKGANRHQDYAGWGDAMTNQAHYRDAKMIKDCGMNFVRGSHYPHDPAFLSACDELGLIFWSENTFWGIGGFGGDGYWNCSAYPIHESDEKEFEANDKRLLKEMIDDHYNHPCVVIWSMTNEPFFTANSVMGKAKNHMKEMLALTEATDPTRAKGLGGAQRQGFDQLGGVIGYNGDGAYFKKPTGPSLVAEYGSHISNRPGVYDGTWGCTTAEEFPWRSGQALWCAFHHGSIAGDMGRMGMIDYFRLPLRQWYFYRELYAKVPPPQWVKKGTAQQLKLSSSSTEIKTDGTDDAQLIVEVCNEQGERVDVSPDVTLEIISGPGLFPTGHKITFKHKNDIDILEGMAAIAFRSYHKGKTLIRATSEGLTPANIEIISVGGERWDESMRDAYQYHRPYPQRIESPKIVETTRDNLAYTRPTRFSSEEANNLASYANDGDLTTRWCAKNNKLPAFWAVDLENFYKLNSVEIIFEKPVQFGFNIDVSDDEKNWQPVKTLTSSDAPISSIKCHFEQTKPVRFLRIMFTKNSPNMYPGIVEIKLTGKTE